MSAVRCPAVLKNFHIFHSGQCEKHFLNMSAGFPTRQIYIFFVFRTTLKSHLHSRRFAPTVRGCTDRRNEPWTNLHGAKLWFPAEKIRQQSPLPRPGPPDGHSPKHIAQKNCHCHIFSVSVIIFASKKEKIWQRTTLNATSG